MKSLKKIPDFKTEEEERNFWLQVDSSEYLDISCAKKVFFSELKPTTKTISLRLPETLLKRIKIKAHEQDIPYQSMIKMALSKIF